MMNSNRPFYICCTCFRTSETPLECHEHLMVCCGGFVPGDERLKPAMDERGQLKSAAPRWFLEAVRIIHLSAS